jgi:hypothetical protein
MGLLGTGGDYRGKERTTSDLVRVQEKDCERLRQAEKKREVE